MTVTEEQTSASDTSWFDQAGLGVFLHWGHASTQGWELSWQLTGGVAGQFPARAPVGCEEYFANSATFAPAHFDPRQWAREIRAAGARYIVLTAKHHDGFAMYETERSDYSSVTAPFGRDVVAEVLAAARAAGLRVGLYFSIIDWHHEDYPRYTDATVRKPYVVGDYPRADDQAWARYREFMIGQLTELLTGYGELDMVWLDGEFEHTAAEWDFGAIRALIRHWQPACMVNDCCVGFGDFASLEQQLEEVVPSGRRELCLTMNDSWGHVAGDTRWKSARDLVQLLVEARTSGANLLLNVGPRGDGTFPPEASERLAAIGGWLDAHGESVYGITPGLTRFQCRLPTGRRRTDAGERIYVYLTMLARDRLVIHDLPVRRVGAVTVLAGGAALPWSVVPRLADVHSHAPDPRGELEIELGDGLGDGLCPVIAIDLTTPTPTPTPKGSD
jgi:alpha-L-fucosidase